MINMKEIPGFPGQYATEDGRIFSCKTGTLKEKPQRLDTRGYLRVNIRDDSIPSKLKTINVHTLVLITYIGPRKPNEECRHLNGNCLDNRLCNLCWGTHKENIQDEIKHKTAVCLRKGDYSMAARLHYTDIYAIVELKRRGYSTVKIATAFHVTQRHVYDIVNKKTWKHLWDQ